MLRSNSKIHPTNSNVIFENDSFDEHRIGETSSNDSQMPFRTRSVDLTTKSAKRRNSSMMSFFSQSTAAGNSNAVEILINYLTNNMDHILIDRVYLKKFEELTTEVALDSHDTELHRIVKSHGWTGSRYRNSEDTPLEAQSLLQALSNLYLRNKMSSYSAHISNLFGLGDEKGADQILSFCPNLLLTFLRKNGPMHSNKVHSEVKSFSFKGACMLADISGFSKFSGAMCSKGVSGLDDLREATNGFLGHFVKTVYEFRGDVVAFAGDALICVFLDEEDNQIENEIYRDEIDARYGCFRALKCACILRNHQTTKLSTHIGVSYGEMKIALLGGLHDQWVYLLNGECVSQLASCIEDAGPKEVVVTAKCYEQASQAVKELSESSIKMASPFMKRSMGNTQLVNIKTAMNAAEEEESLLKVRECPDSTNLLIESISLPQTVESPKILARKMSSMLGQKYQAPDHSRNLDVGSSDVDHHVLIEAAALFVPRPVLAAVYSESLEHIGELRQVTTMFLSLDSYSPVKHRDPTSLQPFFLMTQKILFDSGGFLRQFLVDDKGCVFIAMWGMPSFTYANNCSRALYCAVCINLEAKKLDHSCSIGITTGNVFCGNVGAPERRDYAGIGNEVNLAARLMSKAKGRVLIDGATHNNLNQSTKSLLKEAEEMKLKGMENPITPYQYNSPSAPRLAALDENTGYSTILRKHVKAILSTQMDKITNSNPIGGSDPKFVYFTIILGMPGTGKTTAAEYFRHGLRKRNIPCILIQARPGHEGVPYGLMRELFLEIVGEDNFYTEDQQRTKIDNLIEQAFPESTFEEKTHAKLSLEMMLGVEWSEVFGSKKMDPLTQSGKVKASVDPPSTHSATGEPLSPKTPIKVTNNRIVSPRAELTQKSLSTSTTASVNDKEQYNMLDDYNTTMTRPVGDLTFYKILSVLLKNQRTAIIIEDAHFCDELSWNELNLLLIGTELNLVVLLTMRSVTKSSDSMQNVNPATTNDLNVISNINNNNNKGGGAKRHSVLASNRIASTSNNNLLETDLANRYGMKFQTSASYLSIIGHENSIVIEMAPLNKTEVCEILTHTLKVTNISPDLIQLVLDVSSGNAFWCKEIANFIKERGVKELEKATEGGDKVLKHLILLRMEKLSIDHQLVLKHASIIGDEFSEKMLQAVLPEKLKPLLDESLDLLAEHGFVLCIEEYPVAIFVFQNQLIRQTVYELTPPRDAALIHLAVAEFIEVAYAKNLRPLYPSLAQHYQQSIGRRALAFKYKVKAADQAISRGAFNDGYIFAQSASLLAVSKEELRVLLLVISRALRDINASIEAPQAIRRLSISFNPNNDQDQANRMAAYLTLKISTENALEKLSKGALKPGEGGNPGHKNRLVINKQPSARLNWQPSYVASKMGDDDSDSDEDDVTEAAKKSWCVIT